MLWRHKLLISFLTLLGLAVAGYLYVHRVPQWESKAKMLVKYVVQRDSIDDFTSQSAAGGRGNPALKNEVDLLTSRDIALSVAEEIGAARILEGEEGAVSIERAAGVIQKGLVVELPQGTTAIHVSFRHPEKELVVPVLDQLMQDYFVKHLSIHRSTKDFDVVEAQVKDASERLADTKKKLSEVKLESGVLSLEDAMTAHEFEKNQAKTDLKSAREELRGLEARIRFHDNEKERGTNEGGAEQAPRAVVVEDAGEAPAAAMPSQQVVSRFRVMTRTLEHLYQSELDLQDKYTPGSRTIMLTRSRIRSLERDRNELLAEHPALARIDQRPGAAAAGSAVLSPYSQDIEDRASLEAVRARVIVLEAHLDDLDKQFRNLAQVESKIRELELERDMAEEHYKELASRLESARADQRLDPSRMPNIEETQSPSSPAKVYDEIMTKVIYGIAGAGLALGVGLALLLELVVDRRVKRPIEIQTRLQVPLMMSVPRISGGARRRLEMKSATPRLPGGPGKAGQTAHKTNGTITLPDESEVFAMNRSDDALMPYAEAIRDRIIFNFEMNDIVHKPKLVALTGLSKGAGNSAISRSLARAFAQGDGSKVLLVDLNGIAEAKEPKSSETIVGVLQKAGQSNFREDRRKLYVANARANRNGTGLSSFAPKQLHDLLPHLRASDFDYIVFDMPPVDQTSPTLAMAGLMDKVLLVLDAENTTRETLKWGYSELSRGKADVSCIYNKARDGASRALAAGS